MKEIDLIKYETHSIEFPPESIGMHDFQGKLSVEVSKKRSSEMTDIEAVNPNTGEVVGKVNVANGDKELATARKNGGHVIYATISLENHMNNIITNYLFGAYLPNPKRDFFLNEILCASCINYAEKKKLILRIIDNLKYFGKCSDQNSKQKKFINEKLSELDRLLMKVMGYRNAFAHGKLMHTSDRGCVLTYYSGGHKEYILDDAFWTKIEEAYTSIDEILRKIEESVRQNNSKK